MRAAAIRGAKAVGYEINPILVLVSRILSRSQLIKIRFGDFWYAEFPRETTIIYTFGESRDISRMYEKAELTAVMHEKELYFMSFGFKVPNVKHVKYDGTFYLYRIKPLRPRARRSDTE